MSVYVPQTLELDLQQQQQRGFSGLLNDQHVRPQLLDGLEVLQRNALTPLKQEFIAHSITSNYRNLTAPHFTRSPRLLSFHHFSFILPPPPGGQASVCPVCRFRLGHLSCLADPEDLLLYKESETFGVIQDIILNCTRDTNSLSSRLVGTQKIWVQSRTI